MSTLKNTVPPGPPPLPESSEAKEAPDDPDMGTTVELTQDFMDSFIADTIDPPDPMDPMDASKPLETPKESVKRLLAEREKDAHAAKVREELGRAKTIPSETTRDMTEAEGLILENLQLKERLLKKEQHSLECQMGGLVERIRYRMKLSGDAKIKFGRNNTVLVTE